MVDMTRAHQRAGDFTALEISQKDFHDMATKLIKEQLELIKEQKEYGITIKRATMATAIATIAMTIVLALQYFYPIRQSAAVSRTPILQQAPTPK